MSDGDMGQNATASKINATKIVIINSSREKWSSRIAHAIMALLSSVTESRIFVLGLGLTTTCVVLGLMRQMLVVYRDSVENKTPPPKTQYITQGTEDSLKNSTLEKLIESHSYSIQETAARIVCDRALHDRNTIDELLWEIMHPDHDRREQSIRAIYMLTEPRGVTYFNKPKVYEALVECLAMCIEETPHESYNRDFDSFDFRDPVERFCILILHRLATEYSPDEAIKIGIVQRWIAKEPWGETEMEKQENFRHYCRNKTAMSELMLMIGIHQLGSSELSKAKLIDNSDITFYPGRTALEEAEAKAGVFSLLEPAQGRRLREQSSEERHLRRRHREAMVLNDGSQPIGFSDIIQRDYESPTEERR